MLTKSRCDYYDDEEDITDATGWSAIIDNDDLDIDTMAFILEQYA